MEFIIEVAEKHPLVFLALLGIGLLGAMLTLAMAFKVTQILLKICAVFLSLVALCILGLIALATAEHVIAALRYETPPPATVTPAPDHADPSPQP